MRKTVTAAAMAASLTIGGAAGAALFVPTISGAQEDPTTTEPETSDTDERAGWLSEALAPLVEAGTIDQAQADAVVEALRDARPDRPGHRGPGARIFGEALTDVLGLTGEEIRAGLQDGQTIADIADAQGVAVDDVIAALVAEAEERIATAVENGRLSDDEATEKLAEATEKITELVNGEFEPGDRRGHRHGGPRGGDDTTDDDADDTTGA